MTTPSLEVRAKQVFDHIVDLSDAERDSALESECGSDAVLRDRVRQLLAADADTRFVERIIDRATPDGEFDRERLPRQIDRYQLLRLIATGGMGAVYEAKQNEPIQRRVAVKLIKPGLGSREVIQRFEAERQAVSLMTHSAIARVFDAGTSPDGQPYFVMELVEGVAITSHCDLEKLTIAERLGLFLKVCEGVQHAHRKGIVHRDLKPSNVLVTVEEQAPVPKIIDFGIAKALDPLTPGGPLETIVGSTLGTPESMSPEQAGLPRDIDTRTDIYSLGVLLYELLVGSKPFPSEQLRALDLEQAKRILREQSPDRLSSRANQLQASDDVAIRRHTTVEKLGRRLRGDLEWICEKALQKEPDDRYGSVTELSDDVRRHLANDPIKAGPPTLGYRTAKFARRHKLLAVAIAVGSVALMVGMAGLVFGLQRAQTARAEAELQAERTQKVADFQASMIYGIDAKELGDAMVAQLGSAVAARDPVDPTGEPGKEATDRVATFERLVEGVNRPDVARTIVGDLLLEPAAQAAEHDFADDPEVQARLLLTVGSAFNSLSLAEEAENYTRKAIQIGRAKLGDLAPTTIDGVSFLGDLLAGRGQAAEAEKAYLEVLEAYRKTLKPNDPKTLSALTDLGILAMIRKDYRLAHQYQLEAYDGLKDVYGPESSEAFRLLSTLALSSSKLHRYTEAERQARILVAMGEKNGNGLTARMVLADLLTKTGKFDEAESLVQQTIEDVVPLWGEDDTKTAIARGSLGRIYALLGQREKAVRMLSDSVQSLEASLGLGPATLSFQSSLALALANAAQIAEAERRATDSVQRLDAIFGPLSAATWPAHDALANVLLRAGRYQEALNEVQNLEARAREDLRGKENVDLDLLPFDLTLASVLLDGSQAASREQNQLPDLEHAISLLETCVERYTRVFGQSHYKTAEARSKLADAIGRTGRDSARASLEMQRAITDLEGVFGPDSAPVSDAYLRHAALLATLGRTERALALVERGLAAGGNRLLLRNLPGFSRLSRDPRFLVHRNGTVAKSTPFTRAKPITRAGP